MRGNLNVNSKIWDYPDAVKFPMMQPAAKLQAALDLYQGDFLDGFHLRDGIGFEEWAILQREHLTDSP